MKQRKFYPKAWNYREDLAPYLGMKCIAEAFTYDIKKGGEFEMFLCMHNLKISVLESGLDLLSDLDTIDHMHIAIRKNLKFIRKRKPLKIVGYIKEYDHWGKNERTIVRNIGIEPIHVSQHVWLYTQGQPLGAVPRIVFCMYFIKDPGFSGILYLVKRLQF